MVSGPGATNAGAELNEPEIEMRIHQNLGKEDETMFGCNGL
jgi:hypothetical protein